MQIFLDLQCGFIVLCLGYKLEILKKKIKDDKNCLICFLVFVFDWLWF